MLDRTFLLTLAFLMMLGSVLAFISDFAAADSAAARDNTVVQLPRVVITESAHSAESVGETRPA